MEPVIFYSQNREDLILSAFLADVTKGFYVDVGAYHPVHDSVTKLFYDRGWDGINIEPQHQYFKLLENQRKRDINLQIGISNRPGQAILRSYTSRGLSTISQEMKTSYEKNTSKQTAKYQDMSVQVDTLKNIFAQNKVSSIQFMKVDVEGLEYEVLEGNDWTTYRPEIICIESNHVIRDWTPVLATRGYEEVFFDGLNKYYAAKEAKVHRLGIFKESFPELLVAAPTLSYAWSRQIKKMTAELRKTQNALQKQIELNQILEQELRDR